MEPRNSDLCLKKYVLQIDSLPVAEQVKSRLRTLIKEKGSFKILIVGREGVGKSTLVNALTGRKADESTEGNSEVILWLTPGLKDYSENEQYLTEIKNNCENVDIVIYCIKFAVARAELSGVLESQQGELLAIKKLTKVLGTDWWKNSLFVMTFANALQSMLQVNLDVDKKFIAKLDEWKKEIQKALINVGISKAIADGITVVPAGHANKPQLPGINHWVSGIWSCVIHKCSVQMTNGSSTQPEEHENTSLINHRPPSKTLLTTVGSTVVPFGIGGTAGGFLGSLGGLGISIAGVILGGIIAVFIVHLVLKSKKKK